MICSTHPSTVSSGYWPLWLCALWLCLGIVPSSQVAAHGDLHARIAALTAQLHQEPDNAALYLRRGELYRQHHDWQAALEDVARAAALDPTLPTVELLRGLTYLEARQCSAARQALAAFLQRFPAHEEALVAQAQAAVCLGDSLTAAAEFTQAIALRPRADYYLERAQALVAAYPEALDEALRSVDEGLATLGPVVTLQHYAIDLELRQGRYDAALARLDHLMAESARQETWLARRGEILEQAGRPAAAHDAFTTALSSLETASPTRRHTKAMAALEARLRTALERLRPHVAR